MSDWKERTDNGTSFVGSDVDIFRAHVIASGLRMYGKYKMIPNRAYTPKAMLAAAAAITGAPFTGKDKYLRAADALDALANAQKALPRVPT